jgi:hypothetical protein
MRFLRGQRLDPAVGPLTCRGRHRSGAPRETRARGACSEETTIQRQLVTGGDVLILKDQPRPLTECRRDAPEGVARLVARCLEKSPGDRVQSAQEIHAELKALRRSWESAAERTGVRPTSVARETHASDLRVAVLPFEFRVAPTRKRLRTA